MRHLMFIAALGAVLLSSLAAASVRAASSSVECGQVTAYIAPDPTGPTDGSLQLGQTSPWIVLASAIVSPAAATTLPTIVNNSPTCVALDLNDDGSVTAIDFAASGRIEGSVTFDSGSGFYLFADRLIVPQDVTNAIPELAALFVTSYQAGTPLSITFSVDTATGQFTAFDGAAAFCGTGRVTADGDGQVGNAIISAAVLDADDLVALAGAGTRRTCASIRSSGTVDPGSGNVVATTEVTIVLAPAAGAVTPPPTDAEASVVPTAPSDSGGIAWLAIGLAVVSAMTALPAPYVRTTEQRRRRSLSNRR